MREDQIYSLTKIWLLEKGYSILGGQPPRGTDRFPVIEIKSDEHSDKGSRTSYKPDLVVATNTCLVVIECKPSFDFADVEKLRDIAAAQQRLTALVREIRQRRCLERRNHGLASLPDSTLETSVRCCISYSGDYRTLDGVYSIVFDGHHRGRLFLGETEESEIQ